MSAQELVACLCREGDQHLALGQSLLATAFYLAAFSCHAPSAVRSVRSALAETRGTAVVTTLEAWCRGDGQIPTIHWDGMAVVSLTGTLASAFLAALCPDHPASVLHTLAGLLAHGRHEEVAQRCDALLATHSQQTLELQLTRALAWVLSRVQVDNGVADYLQAFAESPEQTVTFIRAHQQPYLPLLVCTLQDHISGHRETASIANQQETNCHRLMAALGPGGARSQQPLPPTALLQEGRYEDCLAACNQALEPDAEGLLLALPWGYQCPAGLEESQAGEHLVALLVTRAAAVFFLDGRPQDMLGDLQEAFRKSPTAARRHFETLLSAEDRERFRAQMQETAELGFACFREAVRSRPELRGDTDRELLAPVTKALRVLLRVAPPGARSVLSVRLAECLLLAGNAAGAWALCERLLRPRGRQGDCPGPRVGPRAPLLALRGFCALHTGDTRRAREDFQTVVELGDPHPRGCVRALCGRGLLRVLEGSSFLGALDYVTACQLRPEEALLAAKAYVPWNQRGLLLTVLLEEGRRMLQRKSEARPAGAPGRQRKATETDNPWEQAGDAQGVYQLATLLMELDTENEDSRLLAADALYRLGRLNDAHKALLVALSRRPQAAPVLARLALLQLRRGFFYDANQLVKKVVRSGDTAYLQPTLDVFHNEDRQLLQSHCHTQAVAILRARPGGDSGVQAREAISYLSLAIFASGGQASESLLARACCYGFLGQKKTAMFDFNIVLRVEPGNVQALCGRALVHLALGQQKEAVNDIISALKLDPGTVVPEIRSLKPEAQTLITQGIYTHCQTLLSQQLDTEVPLSDKDAQDLLAMGETLVRLDAPQPGWHILLTDVLMSLGSYEEAGIRLQNSLNSTPPSEAAQARLGLLQLKKGDVSTAAQNLQGLVEKNPSDLRFLLHLLEASERQSLAQAAAQEASALLDAGLPSQAQAFCSLAVLADGDSAQHLRTRAACLAELREFGPALRDLDRVLQKGNDDLPTQAEDFCTRGRLLLSLGDEVRASGAFIQALELEPTLALSSLSERPGRASIAQVLHHYGQRCLEDHRHAEAWAAAENGLLVDPEHSGLKKLKARTRREASSGCRLH
ncbi:PREDICTED: tetratricopeptide repeat protein 34 [Chrysochloris asiatica]|uniref:Tetratricopeptide repeat protein 34 n=1 Tax=Chrysochloris asiatica TaxID=185453 RepID=A0A9B0WVQ1_CHRAS|nr:PREDICTED: tetratricopeptide repeat protein 34 [Chrysochloris asiatica]